MHIKQGKEEAEEGLYIKLKSRALAYFLTMRQVFLGVVQKKRETNKQKNLRNIITQDGEKGKIIPQMAPSSMNIIPSTS